MSILRYRSESDIPAHLQARMRSKVSADQDEPKPAATVPIQAIGSTPEAVTGCPDAPAPSEKGMVILPYPISANRYWRNFRGRMVVSSEAKAYKDQVAWNFKALEITPATGDVALTIKLHPKLTAKGKASRTICDLDNVLKVVFDALQGILYVNDKQVKKLTAEVGEPVLGGGLSVGIIK